MSVQIHQTAVVTVRSGKGEFNSISRFYEGRNTLRQAWNGAAFQRNSLLSLRTVTTPIYCIGTMLLGLQGAGNSL